ncbi:hypothetical protein VTP01DRAFT_845 [Rhizomucor pusillus]|uniref:uncharacterized protein n=1 Tax=Rhizomucor pusillus TaxID=4840 RepID=UPI003742C3D1
MKPLPGARGRCSYCIFSELIIRVAQALPQVHPLGIAAIYRSNRLLEHQRDYSCTIKIIYAHIYPSFPHCARTRIYLPSSIPLSQS